MRNATSSSSQFCAHTAFIRGVVDDLASIDVALNDEIFKGLDLRKSKVATPVSPDSEKIKAVLLPGMCHLNADIIDEIYGFRRVRGWIVLERCLILHSVNLAHGRFVCFTPNDVTAPFPFIEDDRVFVRWEDGKGVLMIRRESDPPSAGVKRAFMDVRRAASDSLRLTKMLECGVEAEIVAREMSSVVTGGLQGMRPSGRAQP